MSDTEQLSAYIDGELPTRERAVLEARLLTEPALRRELESLRATSALLRDLPPMTAPRSFTLSPEMLNPPAPPSSQKRAATWLIFPTAPAYSAISAAAAVLLFSLGVFILLASALPTPTASFAPVEQQAEDVSPIDLTAVALAPTTFASSRSLLATDSAFRSTVTAVPFQRATTASPPGDLGFAAEGGGTLSSANGPEAPADPLDATLMPNSAVFATSEPRARLTEEPAPMVDGFIDDVDGNESLTDESLDDEQAEAEADFGGDAPALVMPQIGGEAAGAAEDAIAEDEAEVEAVEALTEETVAEEQAEEMPDVVATEDVLEAPPLVAEAFEPTTTATATATPAIVAGQATRFVLPTPAAQQEPTALLPPPTTAPVQTNERRAQPFAGVDTALVLAGVMLTLGIVMLVIAVGTTVARRRSR